MTDISQIWQFDLRRGKSRSPRDGACFMDAVSWFEYGTLGDHPPCVCPVIAAFGREVNDALSDAARQRLKVFIHRVGGTVDPPAEKARAEYLAWQAIRVFAPLALDAAGLHHEAQELREFSGSLGAAAEVAEAAADAADALAVVAAAAAEASAAADAVVSSVAAAYAAYAASAACANVANADALAASAAARAVAVYAAQDAMIAALDGVLRIGRQAEPIAPERMVTAARAFAEARA